MSKPQAPMPQSPSSLDMFISCPRKYESKYILRTYVDEPSLALEEGLKLHKAMEGAIVLGTKLPPQYEVMQGVVNILLEYKAKGYSVTAEDSLAINAELMQVPFFHRVGYMRCKVDAIALNPARTKAVVFDWKTGKVRDYNTQSALNAVVVQAVYGISDVTTAFVYPKHDEVTVERFVKDDANMHVTDLYLNYNKLREAHATGVFEAIPSGLCKSWCGNFQCEFNGRKGA